MSLKIKLTVGDQIFDFEFKRRISIICGDSGTGKTCFIDNVHRVVQNQATVGYKCESNRPNIRVITSEDTRDMFWLNSVEHGVILADEDVMFHGGISKFIKKIIPHDIWLVVVSRKTEIKIKMECAADSIYQIVTNGNVKTLVPDIDILPVEKTNREIVTEDEKSGNQFYSFLCNKKISSIHGKDSFYKMEPYELSEKIFAVDLAVFGSHLHENKSLYHLSFDVFDYNSFEQLLTSMNLSDSENIKQMLNHPELYANKKCFYSWESFYTFLMEHIDVNYKKGRLPEYVLIDKDKVLQALSEYNMDWLADDIRGLSSYYYYKRVMEFYSETLGVSFDCDRKPMPAELTNDDLKPDESASAAVVDSSITYVANMYIAKAYQITGGSHE